MIENKNCYYWPGLCGFAFGGRIRQKVSGRWI